MSSNGIVNSVRNFLASNFMQVEEEWLHGCVEYLTEDSSNNYSEAEILNLAKEQWLLNDLREICPGSLPANLKNQHKTVINGKFVLQINAAVDIGTPAYQQYIKLQKINTENIEATTKFEDKISSHRMIKLYLTDGVQDISAIEYKPMRNLSCDVTPGCKVLVKGPVECRRGLLLLTESSVELLGGEVQEIAVSHCLAGLLSSKLGLPVTQSRPTPHQDTDGGGGRASPAGASPPRPVAVVASPPRPVAVVASPPRPVAVVASLQVFDGDIDAEQLAALEQQLSAKRPPDTQHSNPQKKLKTDNTPPAFPDEYDFFAEDEEYLRELEAKFDATEKAPAPISSEPFVYIKQLNEMKESDKAGRVFKVKGQIMKLLSKLSVGRDGWSLRCTIVDGTGGVDADFTNAVLSKLVGFTPHEMNQLKKQMATRPELKEKAVVALQKAKDALQVLYCIIELTMLDTPKITCLTPFDDTHVRLLRDRMQT